MRKTPASEPRAVTRLASALLAVWALSASGCGDGSPPAGDAPPSILLVTIDTLRADRVGCYGYPQAETPHLDALAARGVRFAEARSHVPLTLPSHASMLTGLLPPRHGVRGNGLFRLDPGTPTVAGVLARDGYATAAVLASVVLDREYGLAAGFAAYDDNQRVGPRPRFDYLERGADQMTGAARAALEGLAPPFFLWVHLYDPHHPWEAPEPFRSRHAGRPYDAEVSFADRAVGEIVEHAQRRAGGALVVVATSDHGESLGDHGENQHGYTLHRGVLRVPLIVAGPGIPEGRVVDTPVALADLAPTLAEIAGATLGGVDGRSLVAAWDGGLPDPADPWIWEESLHPLYDSGWAPLRGLLTPEWHLVDAPRPQLYDSVRDPDDRHDLAASRPETVERLRRALSAIGARLGDVEEPPVTLGESAADRERLSRLASLGYVSTGAGRGEPGARMDPKDGLPTFLAIERAEELLGRGRADEARAVLEPHIERDPGNPRLWHQLGRALSALRRWDAAGRAFERALELDPRSEFIRYAHARMLHESGDLDGSRRELRRILERNPRAVDAAMILASLAQRAGDATGAAVLLRGVHEAGARDPDLLVRLALDRKRLGELDAAARLLREALELWDANPVAVLEAGRVAILAGDFPAAIETLDACITRTGLFDCRMELARAYVLGPRDVDRARAVLRASREATTDPALLHEVHRRLAALDTLAR